MKDKLVVMFEEELEKRYGRNSKTLYPVERLIGELFHVQNHLFIVNSKKDVAGNFQYCLKHYLRYEASLPPATLPAAGRVGQTIGKRKWEIKSYKNPKT
jgi:hypothetical protein